ncbi:MAG: NlpC/P60 family protein [Acidimicrobiia bacterium]|nr:NlpC/P60 family protein [Acidimicrobiia bacterium]
MLMGSRYTIGRGSTDQARARKRGRLHTNKKRRVKWGVVPAVLLTSAAMMAGCASTGAVPRPFPVPTTAEVPPPRRTPARPPATNPGGARAASAAASGGDAALSAVLNTALALVGTPYRNGGSSPEGFDCSGFTQWVFARHHIALPRETREQYATGMRVGRAAVAPGDLVFFSTVAPGASHVGIALDEDQFIHAPSSRGVVRVERRSSTYWRRRFVGARRVDAN